MNFSYFICSISVLINFILFPTVNPTFSTNFRINSIYHVVDIAWSLTVIYLYWDGKLWSYHPIFISIGFGILLVRGIEKSKLAQTSTKKRERVNEHAQLSILGIILSIIGVIVILVNKWYLRKPHFQSWHAWISMASMISICLSAIAGIYILNITGIHRSSIPYLKAHRFGAVLAMVFSIVSVITGLENPNLHQGFVTYALEAIFAARVLSLILPGILNRKYIKGIRPISVFLVVWVMITGYTIVFAGHTIFNPIIDLLLAS